MNYHINPDSEKAQAELKVFCDKNSLILEVCDTARADQTGKDKDYAGWQRRIRYAFFKEMYEKYNAAALFISHMMPTSEAPKASTPIEEKSVPEIKPDEKLAEGEAKAAEPKTDEKSTPVKKTPAKKATPKKTDDSKPSGSAKK